MLEMDPHMGNARNVSHQAVNLPLPINRSKIRNSIGELRGRIRFLRPLKVSGRPIKSGRAGELQTHAVRAPIIRLVEQAGEE